MKYVPGKIAALSLAVGLALSLTSLAGLAEVAKKEEAAKAAEPAKAAETKDAKDAGAADTKADAKTAMPTMPEADFERAKTVYFQNCAGCHGALRKGATGKSLEPVAIKKKPDGTEEKGGTLKLGQKRLEKIITEGTEGGMNNFSDILSKEEITLMATFLQMTPPVPPEMSLAQMKEHTKVYVDPKDYPTKPMHDRNWENFFLVIERDVGKIAIIDGDKHEVVTHVDSGYAVHNIKSMDHHKVDKSDDPANPPGRFWFTMGRDGKMNKIDLWQTPDKMLVAETKIAYDARGVAVSGDGKYVIGGGYWPPHFAFVDAKTMEPLKVVSTRGTDVNGEFINEARVATVHPTPNKSNFLVAVKELGQVWEVGYKDLDNLKVTKINTAKMLHDGFYDPTGRYFQLAANASNKITVIDTEEEKQVALMDVAKMPHPGAGANWDDKECGPVGGTTHIGEGIISVWGNDPVGHPDKAWKPCYTVPTDGPGLFIRTHPNSKYVWADQTKHPEPEIQQSVKVIDKETRAVVKTIRLTDKAGQLAVHFEFNKDGTEVWASVWNSKNSKEADGEIIVYDANTLEEKTRIKGLYAPTGKFNVSIRNNHQG